MANLDEEVKVFIIQMLAMYKTPQKVADAVKEEFKIEIERQQVAAYNPTKLTGKHLSKKHVTLFNKTRREYDKKLLDIPLSNKIFRIQELQDLYEDTRNQKIKRDIIKQAKDEMHNYELTQLDIQLKQLEVDRIKSGDGEGADDPTPVKVTIQVVDASKPDAEHQSDPECTAG